MNPRDEDRTPPPGDDETLAAPPSGTILPRKIGRYTIQSVIASGGMGTVYKAVQENPRRAVAVKVMRAGVSSPSELRRFEFEAQLLGRLRHPGIAQIYEAGTHAEGDVSVPFFAMEYIPGAKSIVDHARAKKLGVRERVELFARVCEIVHYGHQKGIIHRDLKPSNILIGSGGNPHIIDFGVARATDSDMALTQHQTGVGELLGTLQYMSPEQCAADPHDIDTRSDVYSLGVVLYELLCDRLPYDVKSVPIFEATRLIRDQDPERPSRTDSRLRGDLETVVLKALEKDRDRRYQSAAEFQADLRRFLAHEAIAARPASSAYHLRVFARRNRGFLTAAATVLVVLIAGAVTSGVLYFRNRDYQLQAAELEAKAQGAQNYLDDIVSVINNTLGEEVPIADLLATFGENIHERFAGQPEVEAKVRLALAQKYNYMTTFEGSVKAKEYAALAEEHMRVAMRIQQEIYGEHDPRSLETIEEMASHLATGFDLARAEALCREAIRIREENGDDPLALMDARERLASVLIDRGRLDEAAAINREALSLHGPDGDRNAEEFREARAMQARILEFRGRHDEAVAERRQILEEVRAGGWDEDGALTALARAYVSQGDPDAASEIFATEVQLANVESGILRWLGEERRIDPDAPTLLLFWETWCPYCQLFIPPLQEWIDDAGPLQVVGMTLLDGSDEDAGRDWVSRNGLRFPNAVYTRDLARKLEIRGYPTAIAIDHERVVWRGNPSTLYPEFLRGLARGGRLGES